MWFFFQTTPTDKSGFFTTYIMYSGICFHAGALHATALKRKYFCLTNILLDPHSSSFRSNKKEFSHSPRNK